MIERNPYIKFRRSSFASYEGDNGKKSKMADGGKRTGTKFGGAQQDHLGNISDKF